MKVVVVIPARYASTRFPGKPLARLSGKPIIEWVWERVTGSGREEGKDAPWDAVVATDDCRIVEAVEAFGGVAMLTDSGHRSGTDRCGEVLGNLEAQGRHYDVVVDVQGDEPFVQQSQIGSLVDCFADPGTQIATLRTAIDNLQELISPNNVKVVCGRDGRAIYFSRLPIPYLRGVEQEQWIAHQPYYKHVGIYAFRAETLKEVVRLQPSVLECSESLEQLRWIENGYTVRVCDTGQSNIGIDSPEDLATAEEYLQNEKKQNTL